MKLLKETVILREYACHVMIEKGVRLNFGGKDGLPLLQELKSLLPTMDRWESSLCVP